MPTTFKLLAVASLALAVPSIGVAAGLARPNILWLIAEDFGNHLSCCGTKEVWTPNLDKLAADGVRYPRFYTTAPVCSSSRSAFMTGMYQTTSSTHRSAPIRPRSKCRLTSRIIPNDRARPWAEAVRYSQNLWNQPIAGGGRRRGWQLVRRCEGHPVASVPWRR